MNVVSFVIQLDPPTYMRITVTLNFTVAKHMIYFYLKLEINVTKRGKACLPTVSLFLAREAKVDVTGTPPSTSPLHVINITKIYEWFSSTWINST